MQTERGFVLHEPVVATGEGDDAGTDHAVYASTMTIPGGLEMTTSKDVLEAMATGSGPRKVLVTLGYAAWEEGQLELELAENSWLTVGADPAVIFDTPVEQRYDKALALLGLEAAWKLARGGAPTNEAPSRPQRVRPLGAATPRSARRGGSHERCGDARHRSFCCPVPFPDFSSPSIFGQKRTGVASGNRLLKATPQGTIAAQGDARFAQIEARVREWQPDALVVGVPYHLTAPRTTTRAPCASRQLHGRFRLPVYEVDERYSTHRSLQSSARERRWPPAPASSLNNS